MSKTSEELREELARQLEIEAEQKRQEKARAARQALEAHNERIRTEPQYAAAWRIASAILASRFASYDFWYAVDDGQVSSLSIKKELTTLCLASLKDSDSPIPPYNE